jgi:hypothetical protein
VLVVDGRSGHYVRYKSYFHPLHPIEEFASLLAKAKTGALYLFDNMSQISSDDPRTLSRIELAPFIMEAERDGTYW